MMDIGAVSRDDISLCMEVYETQEQKTSKEVEQKDSLCITNDETTMENMCCETYEKVGGIETQVNTSFGKEVLFQTIEQALPYNIDNVFIAEDYGERKVKYNVDKVNYLAQLILKNDFDTFPTGRELRDELEKSYPFEGDSIWVKKSVIFGAIGEAGYVYRKNNLRNAFEKAGVTAATLSVDTKGEITVEAADGGDLEQLKETLIHQSNLFSTVYLKGEGKTMISDSPEEKQYLVTEMRWMLWHQYGLTINDLVDENGNIINLPEKLQQNEESKQYITDLILYGWRHRMTEDTLLGKITYVNGRVYVK